MPRVTRAAPPKDGGRAEAEPLVHPPRAGERTLACPRCSFRGEWRSPGTEKKGSFLSFRIKKIRMSPFPRSGTEKGVIPIFSSIVGKNRNDPFFSADPSSAGRPRSGDGGESGLLISAPAA